MSSVKLYTIGFTKKNAETFFSILKNAGIRTIVDIRLNNTSQLAGFAKRDDLIYFLKTICDCDYRHVVQMAPTEDILNAYKKKEIDWQQYEKQFNQLLSERKIETLIAAQELNNACLLCAEPEPDQCHRRLVAEYLQSGLKEIKIIHL